MFISIKKSIVKIETWARLGACDEEAMSCGEFTPISSGTGSVILYHGKKRKKNHPITKKKNKKASRRNKT
mgnify:CR=1 FL=1